MNWGVSRNYLIKKAIKLGLSSEELDLLIYIRTNCGASLPNVFSLLEQGFTLEKIIEAYEARQAIFDQYGRKRERSVSIKIILLFIRTFPELESNEDLDDIICQVYSKLKEHIPYILANEAILLVCQAADYYKVINLWTAVEMAISIKSTVT